MSGVEPAAVGWSCFELSVSHRRSRLQWGWAQSPEDSCRCNCPGCSHTDRWCMWSGWHTRSRLTQKRRERKGGMRGEDRSHVSRVWCVRSCDTRAVSSAPVQLIAGVTEAPEETRNIAAAAVHTDVGKRALVYVCGETHTTAVTGYVSWSGGTELTGSFRHKHTQDWFNHQVLARL